MKTDLENEIFTVDEHKFNTLAVNIFHFQYANNVIFRQWVDMLHPKPSHITQIHEIPFLPVSLFKNKRIVTGNHDAELTFHSSSTTGQVPSVHEVVHAAMYHKAIDAGFNQFYGEPSQYSILALLPSYLERNNSGLVYMVNHLMQQTQLHSDFYLNNMQELLAQLKKNESTGVKTLLLGVTYALLDLAEQYNGKPLESTIIMETGGMKGRRKELTKGEVHQILCSAFGVGSIHSEYGMTEMLSQAYSSGQGIYTQSHTMKVIITDIADPLLQLPEGKTGRICIVDLANLNSCSFIATDDLGRYTGSNTFEILGRFDFSDVRGCNLMTEKY